MIFFISPSLDLYFILLDKADKVNMSPLYLFVHFLVSPGFP